MVRLEVKDRLEIEELVYRWCAMLDRADHSAIPDSFTDDGRYGVSGGWDLNGRDALTEHYRGRSLAGRTCRHVCTNLILEAISDDEVAGRGLLTVFRHEGAGLGPAVPTSVLDFHDRYRRGEDGRWRFRERRLTAIFGDASLEAH